MVQAQEISASVGTTWFILRKLDGDYTWAKVISSGDKIDVNALYPSSAGNNYRTIYAHSYVYSPTAQNVYLSMGSDDGIRAWVNGNLVWSNDVNRGHTFNQDRVQVNLNAGWNRLLIKVRNGTAAFDFSARFTDAAGNPVDFRYQLDDPGQFTEVPDTTPPTILNVKTTVLADNKVRVEWVTDEAGSSYLEWGKDANYGSNWSSSALTITHWRDIDPLEANTIYHLRIKSADYFVNTSVYGDFVITTGPGTAPFIRGWLVNGVYTNSDSGTRLAVDYLGGESIARPLDGEGTLAMGKTWTELNSTGDYVDLSGRFGTSPDSVAYAYVNVSRGSTDTNQYYLWLGTTGGYNVFINGVSVYSRNVSREHKFNEDIIPISLVSGWNRLLLKLTPGENGVFGYSARIAPITGNANLLTAANYQEQHDPEVTFTESGSLLQAYAGYDNPGQPAYLKRWIVSIRTSYNLGQSWFPTVQLINDAQGPTWAKMGNKKALFYKKLVSGKWQVAYKVTENDGATWTNETVLTNLAVPVYNIDAAEDPENNKYYIFYSDDNGLLRYMVTSDLITWSTQQTVPVTLAPNSYPNRTPSFSIEKLHGGEWGLAYIAPDDSTYHYSKALFISSKDLTTWSSPSNISEMYQRPSQVSFWEDDNGNLFAGIQRWKWPSDFNMYSSYSTDGGRSWSTPVQNDGTTSSWPSEHYDPIGNVKLYYGKNGKIREAYLLKVWDGPVLEENVFGFGNYSGEEGFGVNPAIGQKRQNFHLWL